MSEPTKVIPPMLTGNTQFQQTSVSGLKKLELHSACVFAQRMVDNNIINDPAILIAFNVNCNFFHLHYVSLLRYY